MLRYMIPLIFVLRSANSWVDGAPRYQFMRQDVQVASPSQVKFALENKFDDTGPGAKQPEYAYNTYKNLEDAIVAYLDDPDTKLPEHERDRAVNKLLQLDQYVHRAPAGLFLKDERFKTLHKPQLQYPNIQTQTQSQINLYNSPQQSILKHFYDQDAKIGKIGTLDVNDVAKAHQVETKVGPFRFQKIHKGIPLSLGHYTREHDQVAKEQFDSHPKYLYSYGVNAKTTGDTKTVQEIRDGGNVRGFYSFIDSDGKVRTVHYTADDRQGFRATVQKA